MQAHLWVQGQTGLRAVPGKPEKPAWKTIKPNPTKNKTKPLIQAMMAHAFLKKKISLLKLLKKYCKKRNLKKSLHVISSF